MFAEACSPRAPPPPVPWICISGFFFFFSAAPGAPPGGGPPRGRAGCRSPRVKPCSRFWSTEVAPPSGPRCTRLPLGETSFPVHRNPSVGGAPPPALPFSPSSRPPRPSPPHPCSWPRSPPVVSPCGRANGRLSPHRGPALFGPPPTSPLPPRGLGVALLCPPAIGPFWAPHWSSCLPLP